MMRCPECGHGPVSRSFGPGEKLTPPIDCDDYDWHHDNDDIDPTPYSQARVTQPK